MVKYSLPLFDVDLLYHHGIQILGCATQLVSINSIFQ